MTAPSWLTVLTTPNRTIYLADTLREIDDAGGALVLRNAGMLRTTVCVDAAAIPAGMKVPPGWDLIQVSDGRGGSRRAMLAVIRLAAAARAETLIYCEDDVRPCRNAVVGALGLDVPIECGFVTLCDVRTLAGPDLDPPRIVTWAADDPLLKPGFWGSQALVIPGRAVGYLALRKIGATDHSFASDVWIGDELASKRAPWQRFGALAPSLFQHVGAKSTIDPRWTLEPHRVAATWRLETDGAMVARALRRKDPF